MTTVTVHDKEEDKHVRMASVDAHHAVAADPERYEIIAKDDVRRPMGSMTDRVASLEERVAALEEATKPEPYDPAPEQTEGADV